MTSQNFLLICLTHRLHPENAAQRTRLSVPVPILPQSASLRPLAFCIRQLPCNFLQPTAGGWHTLRLSRWYHSYLYRGMIVQIQRLAVDGRPDLYATCHGRPDSPTGQSLEAAKADHSTEVRTVRFNYSSSTIPSSALFRVILFLHSHFTAPIS